MEKNIYRNKKTGQKIITKEKLNKKDWELVKQWRDTKMKSDKIKKK